MSREFLSPFFYKAKAYFTRQYRPRVSFSESALIKLIVKYDTFVNI